MVSGDFMVEMHNTHNFITSLHFPYTGLVWRLLAMHERSGTYECLCIIFHGAN